MGCPLNSPFVRSYVVSSRSGSFVAAVYFHPVSSSLAGARRSEELVRERKSMLSLSCDCLRSLFYFAQSGRAWPLSFPS